MDEIAWANNTLATCIVTLGANAHDVWLKFEVQSVAAEQESMSTGGDRRFLQSIL